MTPALLFAAWLITPPTINGSAMPFEVVARRYDSVNTEIYVWAQFFDPPPESVLVRVVRLPVTDEEEVPRAYRILNRGASILTADPAAETSRAGDRAASSARHRPVDDDPSPFSLRTHIRRFLPLARYRVEIETDGETRASEIDTRGFLRILRLHEQDALGLVFTEPQGTPRGVELDPIGLRIETASTIHTGRTPSFEWQVDEIYEGTFHVYLADDEAILWSTQTQEPRAIYTGPELEPGKDYYWIVGGSDDTKILRADGLGRLTVAH